MKTGLFGPVFKELMKNIITKVAKTNKNGHT